MHFPKFFDAVPRITVRDPLAGFLGTAEDGVIEYSYTDMVKLAGHSCPTVASAYMMTRAALGALYSDALPERGGIRVELRDDRLEGVAGVIANVVSLLTPTIRTSSSFKTEDRGSDAEDSRLRLRTHVTRAHPSPDRWRLHAGAG